MHPNNPRLSQFISWYIASCVVLLFMGLFISRAMVSITSFAIIIPAIVIYKNVLLPPYFLAGIVLLIFPALISFFWSNDRIEWWRSVEVKLPLLTITIGLATYKIKAGHWRMFNFIFLCLVCLGSLWSVGMFMANSQQILQGYLQAKVMPTPLDDDHIRFSWLVVLVLLLNLFSIKKIGKPLQFMSIAIMLWLMVYLHILAAKTGLLCMYVAAGLYILHLLTTKAGIMKSLYILMALVLIPVMAWYAFPSFKYRMQYVQYDFTNYSKGNFIPGLSDGARVLSLKAGWHIITNHVWIGAGFGDIRSEVNKWHQHYHPTSLPYERFLPLNEWILYGAGSGIPGILCFTLGIFLVLRSIFAGNILYKQLIVVLLLPLITDDTLESQFGVVIFIFVIMWLLLHKQTNQPPVA